MNFTPWQRTHLRCIALLAAALVFERVSSSQFLLSLQVLRVFFACLVRGLFTLKTRLPRQPLTGLSPPLSLPLASFAKRQAMLRRLAVSHSAAAVAVSVTPVAVTVTTASATSASRRWCSGGTRDKLDAAGATPFTSTLAKTLREKVFPRNSSSVNAATLKQAELLKRWRNGDGTPEQSPRQPETPGTADSSDVEPQMAEGARNVAVSHGMTFRDSRPVDPKESVECKRRRLIYQSRYRGMVEMDLIFGHFARCKLATLDAFMLDEYDVLLKQLDSELFRWLVMGVDAPEEVTRLRCFDELRRFIKEERTELLGSN
ncbi:hypothetical protein, conserved [Leishmania tarentolae]|uniref:Succinate dehydrogenase assembly factor 2, mitochondrial n=1 Tax=Leishmania tarentolae TaxID=5689 RepID=A0A640KMK8_LEITA|nr:hypothetical protein, conserved [Leishmania tarentolae]